VECLAAPPEGERGLAISPGWRSSSAYFEHLLVRIHVLLGNHDRALDLLEPLLKAPYQ
jgi:hypothetical protein